MQHSEDQWGEFDLLMNTLMDEEEKWDSLRQKPSAVLCTPAWGLWNGTHWKTPDKHLQSSPSSVTVSWVNRKL